MKQFFPAIATVANYSKPIGIKTVNMEQLLYTGTHAMCKVGVPITENGSSQINYINIFIMIVSDTSE